MRGVAIFAVCAALSLQAYRKAALLLNLAGSLSDTSAGSRPMSTHPGRTDLCPIQQPSSVAWRVREVSRYLIETPTLRRIVMRVCADDCCGFPSLHLRRDGPTTGRREGLRC